MDKTMLKEYLEKTYGYNEPIFINEIKIESLNDNALRQYFKRLVKSGDLKRFDTGIYYLPKESRILDASYLDSFKVIVRKYIKNNSDTYGYFSGATFANQLGMSTQMPAVLEIVTNKEATKGRTITLGGQNIRLKCPPMSVTVENAGILQLLDAVSQLEKYSELPLEEAVALLKKYVVEKVFTKCQLAATTPALTGQTARKLIEWGIIYEFAS